MITSTTRNYYGHPMRNCQKSIHGAGEPCATLYLKNISPLTCTIGERNQVQMIPDLQYQYHCQSQCHCCLYQSLVTCTNTKHVGDLKSDCVYETGKVFGNSIVCMCIVPLQSRPSTFGEFLWCTHNNSVARECSSTRQYKHMNTAPSTKIKSKHF
jgi:hypothetical protein